MTELVSDPLSFVAVALTVCASFHYLAVTWLAWRFWRGGPRVGGATPALSVLKPLQGNGGSLEENLRAHATQDYPEFELLFGVETADDPAVAVVSRLAAEFSDRPIEIVVCGPAPAGNAKVWRLEELARRAHHDVFLVNDADITVESGYFREVVAELDDPAVGLVSCLYRARPAQGFASLLEALWVSTEFQGQVLAARGFQGMRFALGATMALRRADLDALGGFEALRPFLADDYQLGSRLAAQGRRVVLARRVVETVVPDAGWRDVGRHWLRWSRTVRVSRPWGHAGLLFTHGTVWSLATLGLAGNQAPAAVAALICLALRGVAAWSVGRGALGSELVDRRGHWIFVADLFAFGVWCASFLGNRVEWAGRRYRLDRAGRMHNGG